MSKFLRVHFVEQSWGFAKVGGEVMNASLSVHTVDSNSFGVGIGDVVAVSHVWGKAQCVVENVQGAFHRIEISSPEKMRRLLSIARSKGWENLWLDNICINQEDGDEKSREVMKMGCVYGETKATAILLDSTRSELLRETLPAILQSQGLNPVAALPDEVLGHIVACMHKYVELGRDEWYERLWTVQESTLASTLHMVPVDEDVVYDVSGFKYCQQFFMGLVLVDSERGSGGHVLDPSRRAIWYLARRWSAKPGLTMCDALETTSQVKCSVEKDRVYGILGLIPNVNITASYDDTSLEEVAVMVVKECVNNLKQMDLLHLRGAKLEEVGKHMVPTWHSLTNPVQLHEGVVVHYGNCSYDENVGLMVSNPRVFQAKIVAVIEPDMEPDSLIKRPYQALENILDLCSNSDLPLPKLLRALEEKLGDDHMVELIRGMMLTWEYPQYMAEGKAREFLNIMRRVASIPLYKYTPDVLMQEFGWDHLDEARFRAVWYLIRGYGKEWIRVLGITKDNNCPRSCCKRTYISVIRLDALVEDEDNLVVVDYGGHIYNLMEGEDDDRVPLIVGKRVQEGVKFISTIVQDRGILHDSEASKLDLITMV